MEITLMTVIDLAKKLGLDKSSILKKVRKRRLTITKVRRITGRGIQLVCAVPEADALAIVREYEEARASGGCCHGEL